MITENELTTDPMAALKQEKKEKSRLKKIELTGLTESYCKICNTTKSIEQFDVKLSWGKKYRPRKICFICRSELLKDLPPKRISYDNPAVKATVKKSGELAAKLITDAYIKRLYAKCGFKAKDVTSQMIVDKRKQVIERRESIANGTHLKRKSIGYYNKIDRSELRDSYVRSVIKNSHNYKGEEITDEMIEKKRKSILLARDIQNNKKQRKEAPPYVFFVPLELKY